MIADAYERNGDVDLAEETYIKALRVERFNPAFGIPFAQFLLRYGKADQAERVLTEVRANAPGHEDTLTLLAQVKLNRQDWFGAQEVADALKRLGETGASNNADQILAAALGGQQKHDESIAVLEAAAAGSPDEVSPMTSLVQAYVAAGKLETAEQFLKSVVDSNPDNVGAHVLLGSLALLNQRIPEAEAAFATAIEKAPQSTSTPVTQRSRTPSAARSALKERRST